MAPRPARRSLNQHPSDLPARLVDEAEEGRHLDLLIDRPLIVGVSGGPDSVALLHALSELRADRRATTLKAAHFNHGLRGDAAMVDARLVAALAKSLGVELISGSADVAAYAREQKLSLEDAARQARYNFFRALVETEWRGWAVAVAHTADDQAETVLMSILRGTGLAGLAGMQIVGQLPVDVGEGPPITLFRPLLGIWRDEVLAYLAERGAPFQQDSSNLDIRITRNRIRHELLTLLARDYNPGIKSHLANLATIAHLEDAFLESAVDEVWNEVAAEEPDGSAISIITTRFESLHRALQLRLVRRAVGRLSGTILDLDFAITKDAADLLVSSEGGELHLRSGIVVEGRPYWAGLRLASSSAPVRAALHLYGEEWPLMNPDDYYLLIPGQPQQLQLGWQCLIDFVDDASVTYDDYTAAFSVAAAVNARLAVRTRRPGDRIAPMGLDGTKSLKELYIDAKIPAVIRDTVAVVAHPDTDEVLWVPGPGGRRSADAAVRRGAERVLRVRFTRSSEGGGTGV